MIYLANGPDAKNNLLKAPPLTLRQILGGALVTGCKGAVVLAILSTLVMAVAGVLRGYSPNLANAAAVGGGAALAGFFLFFPIGILRRSRPLQDGSFRVAGFLATFFGLAILIFFFGGLLVNVWNWFYYTPLLVEIRNKEVLQAREELKEIEKVRNDKRMELDQEIKQALAAAENEAEKKEILKSYNGLPEVRAKLEKQEELELAKTKTPEQRQKIRAEFDVKIRAVGGAVVENIRSYEVKIGEKKQLADFPIRETSTWAVLVHFFFDNPSHKPEAVGIKPALLGSIWLALIMICFAVPIGTGAALYLEEYRHSGRLAYWIQVNINNLAGVPSVVYGIMGAYVFVELIFKPLHRLHEGISVRNLLGGGLTLAMLTLPVIIVSAQEAIRAVPNSIRQGAYALGATHWQVIRHHILPLARPGIMTGTILAVSRAIGEAAPLILFGATTFVAFSPDPFSEFTALPIQIYNWAQLTDAPEIEGRTIEPWSYNMALASLVLLLMLVALNAIAIYLRNRAQKKVRW
jgi:phosphate transport system permease protein